MLLDDSTPCWGRAGLDLCSACARLQAPAEYTGSFPQMNLLVPPAALEVACDGALQWFCAERRSTGLHRPAAVCDAQLPAVGAPAHIQTETTCP